jgi:hypothetical protein
VAAASKNADFGQIQPIRERPSFHRKPVPTFSVKKRVFYGYCIVGRVSSN